MKVLLVLMVLVMTVANCFAQEACNVKDSKILILYYSQTGVTKKAAEVLQKKLGADIEAIEAIFPTAVRICPLLTISIRVKIFRFIIR